MRGLRFASLALAALLLGLPAQAQDKPLAGQSISVLLPWVPDGTAAKFEAETGIHAEIQTLSWDDVRPKLVTAFLAGTSPADVAELDWSWTGQFGAAGWLMPLNDLIDADTVADIKGSTIFTIGGNLLAVPYTNDFRVMLINQKHFDAAGITKAPATLDELVAAAKAIKAKGVVEYPIGLPLSPTEGTSTTWYLLTKAFGGDLFDADFNPLFTSPDSAGYKALAFELQLLKNGLVDPASVGLRDSQINDTMFSKGLTSIMVSGEPGRLSQMNDPKQSQVVGDARAILVATASGTTRSYGLLEGLSIPTFSQNKDAALAFVKWYTSASTQDWLYANGTLPTRTSVLASLNGEGKLLSGDVLVEQSKYVEALFAQGTPTWYPQFSSAVNTSINSAAKGEITVDQAMQAIAEAVKQARAE